MDTDNRLTFKLALEDNPQQRVRLEVRWDAEPATLAKGAVDYIVEVRAGGDALAEKTVTHVARGPQKCVFTQDDFGDLEGNERFEAEVVIRALTEETLPDSDAAGSTHHAVSEDFILCFGVNEQPARSSAGNVFPSLALAAIQVARDAETFDRLADNPGNRQAFSADKRGYIACRVEGKAARVLCPNLLLDLAADWAVHQGDPGGHGRPAPCLPESERRRDGCAGADRGQGKSSALWLPARGELQVSWFRRRLTAPG